MKFWPMRCEQKYVRVLGKSLRVVTPFFYSSILAIQHIDTMDGAPAATLLHKDEVYTLGG